MSNRIRRHQRPIPSAALTTSLATTAEIEIAEQAGGAVLIPAGSPITSLTYHGAREPGGAFVPLYDSQGLAVVQTVAAGRGYPLPEACFPYGALKLVANAAGTVELSLKG